MFSDSTALPEVVNHCNNEDIFTYARTNLPSSTLNSFKLPFPQPRNHAEEIANVYAQFENQRTR